MEIKPIAITLMLILLSNLAIATPITDEDLLPSRIYELGDSYRIGTWLYPDTEIKLELKSVGDKEKLPQWNAFLILADTSPHAEDVTPPENMTLTYSCNNKPPLTVNLDSFSTWQVYGYIWLLEDISLTNTPTTFSTTNESDYIWFSASCTFEISGGYAYILTQTLMPVDKSLAPLFTIPYSALKEVTERSKGLIFTLFDVFNIGLLVIGFFIFLFIPVFVYKTLNYFLKGFEFFKK